MSEKWETVSKSNAGSKKSTTKVGNGVSKVGNGVKALKKDQKVYNMEDVLPASSVENMYANAFDPVVPKSPKKEANGTAKPSTKAKSQEKKIEKPRIPTTIGEAVKSKVRVEDLKNLIEDVQLRWPDSPLLWLRDVAGYLNHALVTEPECEGDVLGGEPVSALTANMRKVIGVMLQKCEDSMRETFFETCVANTAHELAKGQCVAGWRVLTQLIADLQPTVVTANIPRYVELRNSYQNRPNVGLSILWSVGQAGNKSLHSGIKVWLEIMLPLITMRHYSKFVVDYLSTLLTTHNISSSTQMNKPVMDISNFITVQDTFFVVSTAMNKEHAKTLKTLYPSLRAISLAGCRNYELFPALLPKLANLSTPDQVLDTLDVLATCLTATPAAMVHWHKAYTSHLGESGQLLNYLESNWSQHSAVLDSQDFQETIEAFQDYNSSVTNKDGLQLATEGCNALAARFTTKGMAWFPWKTLSFLLLIATAAIINLDVERSGSFKSSSTGQFLVDIGQYERVVASSNWVFATTKQGQSWMELNTRQGRDWAQVTLPLYYAKGKKVAGPYLEVAGAKAGEIKVLLGHGLEKARVMGKAGLAQAEAFMPGLQDRLTEAGVLFSKGGALLVIRAREILLGCKEALVLLVNGEVDWSSVRLQVEEGVLRAQANFMALFNYIQLQVKQLVK